LLKPLKTARRIIALLLLDIACVVFAFLAAAYLRFEFSIPSVIMDNLLRALPFLLLAYLGTFLLLKVYTVMWRYATGRNFVFQAAAAGIAGLVTLLVNHFSLITVPRSVLLIACLFVMALGTASRLTARSYRWHQQRPEERRARKSGIGAPMLIVGAGEGGNYILGQSRRNPHLHGRPVALVDDAPDKQGMRVQNVPVLGKIADIPALAEHLDIAEIIIALPSVKGERLREIVSLCNATGCKVRILSDPGACEQTAPGAPQLREPNLADFLSREEVILDSGLISGILGGKTVLVTGGGGSIGSEICRQVMKFSPKALLVFDIYENCAYELLMELRQRYGADCPVQVLVGSVRDRARLDEVMAAFHPDVVFHAAAHKHVPLMEVCPAEAVKNNVFGTLEVMQSAEAHGVGRFVMLSTDKAVNPSSVMGATKRVAELLMQQFAKTSRMKCMAVRFGNVLGSHGSVIPLFERQIRTGGPVTLTHQDMTRYFMTIPEAAQLVLQAGSMEDSGRIYVLDMGQPVLIRSLAEKLIRFYGLEPDVDIEIKVTGLRPGEKLYEELLLVEEQGGIIKTSHDKIMVAPPLKRDGQALQKGLARLKEAATRQHGLVVPLLEEMLPNFKHLSNGEEAAAEPTQGIPVS
jgi:FlaA1/EpsC-like NDP-sugar epimerase